MDDVNRNITDADSAVPVPPEFTTRRAVIVDLTLPAKSWSARELTAAMKLHMPMLDPVVWGEVDVPTAKAARRKINQATREVEAHGDIPPGVLHTLYKAMSFFRDTFPDKFYRHRINTGGKKKVD
jgi:hypothetical protein